MRHNNINAKLKSSFRAWTAHVPVIIAIGHLHLKIYFRLINSLSGCWFLIWLSSKLEAACVLSFLDLRPI